MNPFDMIKNLGNLNNLKEQLEQTKNQLADIRATGSAGGNMVRVTLNGHFEIVDIFLDPICVDNRDVPMLQDLIIAAHHDALNRMQEELKNKMGPMMAGLNIPGMN